MTKTLVCIIAQTRSHEVTWDNFKKNVLDELHADLALCIGINKDYLIITKKKISHIRNQLIINDFPISIHKLIEKLNISFLKLKYSEQSQIKVGTYIIDLNSREMIQQNLKIKLTEKETNIIIFISNSTKPMSVSDLQTKVWHHQSELETHTVETHIYRLRKKIFDKFKDNNFILSKKDGYSIS